MSDLGSCPCDVCGFGRSSAKTFSLGGNDLHLCWHCRQIEGVLRSSGALPVLPHCRFLIGCEFEYVAVGRARFSVQGFRGWSKRLAYRLSSGGLRGDCECDACRSVAAGVGSLAALNLRDTSEEVMAKLAAMAEAVGPLPDGVGLSLTFEDEVALGRPADEIPLIFLKSMAPGRIVTRRDGTESRAEDEVLRRKEANAFETLRGPLLPLSGRAMPAGPVGMSEAEKKADTERARRFWRGVAMFGEGGYLHDDGIHYVAADGECHRVPRDV